MAYDQYDHTDPDLANKTMYRLLEQISKRDQKIAWMNAEKTATLREFMAERAEGQAILLDTQAKLQEKEAQLRDIVNSRTWKIALKIQRVRTFFVPPESRRAQILEKGLNVIFSPFNKNK